MNYAECKFLSKFGVFFLTACGNEKATEKKETDATAQSEEKSTTEENTATTGNEVSLYLTGNDQMKYDKTELKVKAGQTITLELEHVGQMSLDIMGHNFVLLKPGTDLAAFAMKAIEFKDNDYIPEGDDSVIVHTEMIGGGEKTSITFEAPEKGIYDFICSFPGHYGMMQGKFIVE